MRQHINRLFPFLYGVIVGWSLHEIPERGFSAGVVVALATIACFALPVLLGPRKS